jgi:hypothetical protein
MLPVVGELFISNIYFSVKCYKKAAVNLHQNLHVNYSLVALKHRSFQFGRGVPEYATVVDCSVVHIIFS